MVLPGYLPLMEPLLIMHATSYITCQWSLPHTKGHTSNPYKCPKRGLLTTGGQIPIEKHYRSLHLQEGLSGKNTDKESTIVVGASTLRLFYFLYLGSADLYKVHPALRYLPVNHTYQVIFVKNPISVTFTCLFYCTKWNTGRHNSRGKCWAVNIINQPSLVHPVCEIVTSYPSAITTDSASRSYVAKDKKPPVTGIFS